MQNRVMRSLAIGEDTYDVAGTTYTLGASGGTITLEGQDGSDSSVTLDEATSTTAGLMSAADKVKLDLMEVEQTANWAVYSGTDTSLTFLYLAEPPVEGTTTIRNKADTADIVVTNAYPAENSGAGWAEVAYEFDTYTNVPWYANKASISSVEFRDRMPMLPDTTTGHYAVGQMAYWFYEYLSLTSIELPDGLTSAGENVASYCTNLTSIVIPDSVTWLGYGAFASNKYLTSIELPKGLTEIGAYALKWGDRMTFPDLPDGLLSIGEYAFNSMGYRLSESWDIRIPASVTSIGEGAFAYINRISSVTFEGTPTTIASNAFLEGTRITHIYVPWAQGAIPNAPWGATNATVHYDHRPAMADELATASANGLMSSAHYSKLNAMPPIWVGTQAELDVIDAGDGRDAGTVYIVTEAS